jgi:hypothetical protein
MCNEDDAGGEEITLLSHRLTPGLAGYVILIGVDCFSYSGGNRLPCDRLVLLDPRAHTEAVAEER